jgi:hypothetical protein
VIPTGASFSAMVSLARMNMILHNNPEALVQQGNTLTDPKFKDGATLKTFDYVVANPPFSDKRWSIGLDPLNDPYERFALGVPPGKQGDYAYLLHIIRSLKSTCKGACILPHGVLFRGNAEAEIRRNLVRRGYLKGIIGLPANLFYGTGIPACIVVLDKQHAHERRGIFMLDASRGFMKDGPKNRLRAQEKDKGWVCDLIPKSLIVARYYAAEQVAIDRLTAELGALSAKLVELEQEHGGDEGAFSELEKVNKVSVAGRLREIKDEPEAHDEAVVLNEWLELSAGEADTMAERYEAALPGMQRRVAELEFAVGEHLQKMGFSWN